MPSSTQESLIRLLSERSFGAPFVWEPSTYPKGPGFREPADLAWLCRETLFLMNMQTSRATHDVQTRHNLRQLHGWLRAWSNGERLRGENDWQRFDLGLTDIEQIVLVSVVSDENADNSVQLHPLRRNPADAKVAFTAVVSESLLTALADSGGGAADFAGMLAYMAQFEHPFKNDIALQYLAIVERDSRALAAYRSTNKREAALDNQLWTELLQRSRQFSFSSEQASGHGAGATAVAAHLNDVDMLTAVSIVYRMSDLLRMLWDPAFRGGGVISVAAGTVYSTIVSASRPDQVESMFAAFDSVKRAIRDDRPSDPVLHIHLFVGRSLGRDSWSAMMNLDQEPAAGATDSLVRATADALAALPLSSQS